MSSYTKLKKIYVLIIFFSAYPLPSRRPPRKPNLFRNRTFPNGNLTTLSSNILNFQQKYVLEFGNFRILDCVFQWTKSFVMLLKFAESWCYMCKICGIPKCDLLGTP